jgi:hypothetical protein
MVYRIPRLIPSEGQHSPSEHRPHSLFWSSKAKISTMVGLGRGIGACPYELSLMVMILRRFELRA